MSWGMPSPYEIGRCGGLRCFLDENSAYMLNEVEDGSRALLTIYAGLEIGKGVVAKSHGEIGEFE